MGTAISWPRLGSRWPIKEHVMSRIELPGPSTYVPVARSFLYRSLSLGFARPTRDIHAALRDGRFIQDLWDKLSLIAFMEPLLSERDPSIRWVSENMRSLSFEDVERGYTLGLQSTVSPARLTGRRRIREGEGTGDATIAEIRKCYELFGLITKGEEVPCGQHDHFPIKLELLHYLTLKEFQAGGHRDKAKLLDLLTTQKDFLERHLISQLPRCLAALRKSPGVPAVYTELTRIASEFVSRDIDWITLRISEESASSETAQRSPRASIDVGSQG